MIWHKITDKAPEFPCLLLHRSERVHGPHNHNCDIENYTHWTPWTPPEPELSNAMRAFEKWRYNVDKSTPSYSVIGSWRAALEWAVRELENRKPSEQSESNDPFSAPMTTWERGYKEGLCHAAKLIKP